MGLFSDHFLPQQAQRYTAQQRLWWQAVLVGVIVFMLLLDRWI